jgi:hypothetical protein
VNPDKKLNWARFTDETTGGLCPRRIVKKTVGLQVQTGARSRLKRDLPIRQARAEVLEMTAGERTIVGEGNVTLVPEMMLHPEK